MASSWSNNVEVVLCTCSTEYGSPIDNAGAARPSLTELVPDELRGARSWSLLVPPEHTHGPKGIPPARSTLAFVQREVHPAGMGIL